MPRQQVSRAAISLIKRFEGYRRKAAQLPDGRWTIGYGHTLTAREGAEVSEADAEALLIYDMMCVARAVDGLVYADLNDNQFDALCAFAFSVGLEAFRRSDVLKRVNEGSLTQAAFALELWRRAEFEGERIVIDALVRRRASEKLLFLTPPGDAWRPAPSAVLRPELDPHGPDATPRDRPVEVAASLDGETVELTREAQAAEPPGGVVAAAAEAVGVRLERLYSETDATASAEEPVGREAAPGPEPSEPTGSVADAGPGESPVGAPAREEGASPRVLIDDTAPYEFVPALVQPIDEAESVGPLGVVLLTFLGLAFLGGGVFWAWNAPRTPDEGVFTPVLVGWLAGVAGVGFIAAAIFVLLQRIARNAGRSADRGS